VNVTKPNIGLLQPPNFNTSFTLTIIRVEVNNIHRRYERKFYYFDNFLV